MSKGLFVKTGVKALILDREREYFLQKDWPKILEQVERLQLSPQDLLAKVKES